MSASEHELNVSANPEGAPPIIASNVAGSANDDSQVTKSRRRRRPADSENQAKSQAFYFVDSNSSSKEKRAHVMRHHVQEKRKQRKRSHGTLPSPSEQLQEASSWQTRKDSGYDTDNIQDPAITSAPGLPEQDSSLPIRFSAVNPHAQPTPMQLEPAGTHVDTSPKDPFSGIPYAQCPEDLELIDYWTNKLTYWSGQNPYIKTRMFQIASQHIVPFQAVILTYCARAKAQVQENPNNDEAQRYVIQARKNIQDGATGALQVHPDHLVVALSGLALSEDRFGDKQVARAYLEQASRIMRPHSGRNFHAEAFLHYVRFLLPSPNLVVEPSALQWLVAFLRGAEQLMIMHSAPEYHAQAPQRLDMFQDCQLFALLSSGPRPSQVPHASRMYVVRDPQTQEVSRTTALLYITAAMWDFKDSADQTNRFLIYLKGIVDQHQLAQNPACESLLYILLEQGCDPDLRNAERAWSVCEILKTHRLLRPELQFNFNEILMSFLTLRSPVRGIDVFEEELYDEYK
ncbi:hypothetical protein N7456_003509 [Penicillium angulare]|uniref:Uncharacterized protein n=1 Tax=Penicillium angulare TaxID=116970 RepID=A0A9W9FUY4_9EURO|nr:hypothetical protein N7456_003509 [Penicillium angulare]